MTAGVTECWHKFTKLNKANEVAVRTYCEKNGSD